MTRDVTGSRLASSGHAACRALGFIHPGSRRDGVPLVEIAAGVRSRRTLRGSLGAPASVSAETVSPATGEPSPVAFV